jgi:hypothetical protein
MVHFKNNWFLKYQKWLQIFKLKVLNKIYNSVLLKFSIRQNFKDILMKTVINGWKLFIFFKL